MARSLRIPGLIDLVRVDARSDIRGLANDARLDRRFDAAGPLINRILVQRIRSVLRIDGVPLPSLAPREDGKRLRMREALRGSLEPAAIPPLQSRCGMMKPSPAWRTPCAAPGTRRRSGLRRSRRSGGCSFRIIAEPPRAGPRR